MSDEKKLQDLTEELRGVVTEATKAAQTLADRKQAIENVSSDEAIINKVEEAVKATQSINSENFKANQGELEGRFKSYGEFLKSKTNDGDVKEVQRLNDDLLIAGAALSKSKGVSLQKGMEMMKNTEAYKSFNFRVKDLTTGGSGTGAEWIPTGFSSELAEDVRANLVVAANIPTFSAPTNPFSWPVLHGVGTALKATAEASAYTEGDPTTAKVTFDAEKLYGYIQVSDEFTADSAFAVAPVLRSSLTRRLGEGLENAIINGDKTDAAHFDSNVTSAASAQKLLDGLRYRIHATTAAPTAANGHDAGGDKITSDDIVAAKKLLGKYGLTDTALVLSVGAFCDLLTDDNVVTVDKLGSLATVLTGELATCFGIPLLNSTQVKTDLNANGHYDGVTTTRGEAILFNRQSYLLDERGGIQFETQRVVASGADDVVLSGRWDLQTFAPSSGVNVAVIYNTLT